MTDSEGRALIVTPQMSDNSTGRTFVTWMLLRSLGWSCTVVAVEPEPSGLFFPLRQTEFAQDCRTISRSSERAALAELDGLLERSRLVVCTKAYPESFGRIMPLVRRRGGSLVLDYDDPDLEPYLPSRVPWLRLSKRYARHPLRSGRYLRSYSYMKRWSDQVRLIVSNPVLQQTHGGTIVPHLRDDLGPGQPHTSARPRVGFIGSVRPHKGVDDLRIAAREAGDLELFITDGEPADSTPNERWLGNVSYDAAMRLVRELDIVVVPSQKTLFSEGQLPAKLMDGMFAGRAVIASDLQPARWALGDTGLLYPPGDVAALTAALRQATDPTVRSIKGEQARERALREFTVHALEDTARRVFGTPADPLT